MADKNEISQVKTPEQKSKEGNYSVIMEDDEELKEKSTEGEESKKNPQRVKN